LVVHNRSGSIIGFPVEPDSGKEKIRVKSKADISTGAATLSGIALGAVWYGAAGLLLPADWTAMIPVGGAVAIAAVLPLGLLRRDAPPQLPEATLNELADEIWVISRKSEKIWYINGAAGMRTGLDLAGVTGRRLRDVLPSDQYACLRRALAEPGLHLPDVLHVGGQSLKPSVALMKDGHHIVLTLRDITLDLVEERLREDFISTVSHELRSPLTAIKGSMGLLLSNAAGELHKPARALLEIAHRNSERLVLILNDILDLQKIVDGGMTFVAEEVDAVELVHEAIAASAVFLQRFDLQIKVTGADVPVLMHSDPNRIIQVLGNLLTNAAKFSHAHGIITISVTQSPDTVTIGVRDEGAGIPTGEQTKIFERFADMSNSDRQKKGGSGLGLSICKAIVEKLGGSIGFESTQGVGTEFHISIPRKALREVARSGETNVQYVG
jgi:signal transduction histidine kinase